MKTIILKVPEVGDLVRRTKSGGAFSVGYTFIIKEFVDPDGMKGIYARDEKGSLHNIKYLRVVRAVAPKKIKTVKYELGEEVIVYDRYRFAIPAKGNITRFSDTNDGVEVKLTSSNSSLNPVGSLIWVHAHQLGKIPVEEPPKWTLKKGETIEVSSDGKSPWYRREFLTMDGDNFVCRSTQDSHMRFTAWPYARPVEVKHTLTLDGDSYEVSSGLAKKIKDMLIGEELGL